MSSTNDIQLLVTAIKNAIDSRLFDLHTAMPAEVVSFNASNNTVVAQPVLKRKFSDGSVKNLPQIQNVPVCFPRGGDGILTFPIRKGDYVLLVFSERSIDVWWDKGGIVNPDDARKHNLSDAIAIPGVYPRPKASARVSSSHVRLENNNASIELQSNGKFKIRNLNGEELFDLLSQLALACSQISNSSGPTFNAATFTTLKTKFDSLKGT
jgi:hypothetical protein